MAGHVVTAALVITKKEDGSDLYLYEGSELPDFVKDAEVKRLVGLGFVDKVAAGAEPTEPTSESN